MSTKNKSFLIGRDAETGRLKPVEAARADRAGSVVERMPKKGYGDSPSPKKK